MKFRNYIFFLIVVCLFSYSGFSVAAKVAPTGPLAPSTKIPANTKVGPSTKVGVKVFKGIGTRELARVCGEDYSKSPITDLSTHYQDYFNEEYGSENWYYCVIDEAVASRMQCATGWPAVGPSLYSYGCQKTFESESSIVFPDATSACHSGYSSFEEDNYTDASLFDDSFFASYRCNKDGARYSESPCNFGYQLTLLHNANEIICYK